MTPRRPQIIKTAKKAGGEMTNNIASNINSMNIIIPPIGSFQ